MVKFRKASKPGVTVRFVGGRFRVTVGGATVPVDWAPIPQGEAEIRDALERILKEY